MPASGILCQGIAAGLFGSASGACDTATATAGAAQSTASFASDPLGNTANHFVEATVWFWGRLADIIDSTTAVDFTNPGFLKTYALMFGASSVLVVLFWLIAVGKRVVRGVGPGQAIGDAYGFLVLAVFASALAPAVLGMLMSLSGAATTGLMTGIGADAKQALTGLVNALNLVTPAVGAPGAGGPVVLIIATLVGILVGLVLWLELLLVTAALYVVAVFGPAVLAGLVDRDKWGHVHRWMGFIVALALVKPAIVVVIGLGFGLAGNAPADAAAAFSSVLAGIAVLVLAVLASGLVLKFVPIIGEHLSTGMEARRHLSNAGPAAAIPGPAQIMQNSISARRQARANTAETTKAATAPATAARTAASRVQPPTPPPPSQPSPRPSASSATPAPGHQAAQATPPLAGGNTTSRGNQ